MKKIQLRKLWVIHVFRHCEDDVHGRTSAAGGMEQVRSPGDQEAGLGRAGSGPQ